MLKDEIIWFFKHHTVVIVTTIDNNGLPHSSCKGIVDIEKNGHVYVLDLYRARTFANLKANPLISLTGVDEHKFIGYCLKGKARIVERKKFTPSLMKAWEKRLNKRITKRLLKEIRGEKGHDRQPEVLMPRPAYLIKAKINEVVDLTPQHIK